MRLTLLTSLAVTALLAVGCSSAVTVDQSEVEAQVSSVLEEKIGTAPDDVSCPGDLDGEVGATMTCVLTAGEDKLDTEVTVDAVDGEQVDFSVEVAEMGAP